jgi:ATP adenylyltransferase/5',5'''-P-1,P-4-tetraphosphate phosphorylase II
MNNNHAQDVADHELSHMIMKELEIIKRRSSPTHNPTTLTQVTLQLNTPEVQRTTAQDEKKSKFVNPQSPYTVQKELVQSAPPHKKKMNKYDNLVTHFSFK